MPIKWKIALVEDDRRLARAVATGLGEEGYTVRAVESAGRGLELVREWNPDVVLLDLMLPDNEGAELFEAFRSETFGQVAAKEPGTARDQYPAKSSRSRRSTLRYHGIATGAGPTARAPRRGPRRRRR